MIEHVMRKMCETCIFHPGNRMDLRAGRLKELIRETDKDDTNVICHQSKGLLGKVKIKVWCKGSVDRRPGQAVRVTQRLGILKEYE